MKNNKIILGIGIILIVLIVGVASYHAFQKAEKGKERDRLILEIKNGYAPFVETQKEKEIYILKDNTYQKVGMIYQNSVIPLIEKEIKSVDDIYYPIKDTNYYIDYKDIKKVKEPLKDISFDHYFSTNKINLTKAKLYQNEKLMLEIEGSFEFDVLMKDKEKYYIKFLNQIYYIQEDYELIEKELTVNLLKDISVLNFSNDISDNKLEEVLKYLKENNYQSLEIVDFERWVQGKVNLEDKKVLLLSYQELSEAKKNLLNQYEFSICINPNMLSFESGDSKIKMGDTKYYKYEIHSTTSLERIKDMLNGIREVRKNNQGIAVLNYHFFYDGNAESCNETICLDISNFRRQLDYLKNNGYKTLTMQEFNDWMDKKISLPEKSVLLTIDDGAMGTSRINGNKLIPILEEYQMNATLFLITGWWNISDYQSQYLEVYSHGDELHHNNFCRNESCGFKGLYLSKEELIQDLNISIQKLGKSLAFCYPFYAKSNTMVEALKETGFQLGFIGGNKKVTQFDNKYSIPRYVVYKNTSLNSFIQMVS